ncbi:MAG: CarD family transcriptional regulator [Anaerolineae bacterium]|jgi:CarD family transcriptional regulator
MEQTGLSGVALFEVGSDVVHPNHGAGTIVEVERKRIGEHSQRYYVIDIPSKAMRVMVPVDRADATGLREIRSRRRLRQIFEEVLAEADWKDIEEDHARRFELYTEMLKEGRFRQVVRVVTWLCMLRDRKRLGMRDMTLYDHGRHLLAGEVALAEGINDAEALAEVDLELEQMARRTRLLDALEADHSEMDVDDLLEKRERRRSTWSRTVAQGDVQQVARVAVELTVVLLKADLNENEAELLGQARASLVSEACEVLGLPFDEACARVGRHCTDSAALAIAANGQNEA